MLAAVGIGLNIMFLHPRERNLRRRRGSLRLVLASAQRALSSHTGSELILRCLMRKLKRRNARLAPRHCRNVVDCVAKKRWVVEEPEQPRNLGRVRDFSVESLVLAHPPGGSHVVYPCSKPDPGDAKCPAVSNTVQLLGRVERW